MECRVRSVGLSLVVTLALGASALVPGCAHDPPQRETPDLPPAEEEPERPGALEDWSSRVVEAGTTFRLEDEPIGVSGPDVVLTLARVDWAVLEDPDGSETRTGTVSLVVRHGDDMRNVTLDEGDSRTVFGARLELLDADLDVSGGERQTVYAEMRVTSVE
ncbi:MAG: hypothetical protein ACQEXJ_22190 [Myxococcota bacterium]